MRCYFTVSFYMSYLNALRASSCLFFFFFLSFALQYLQPGEMGLEEIEDKLGSLIPSDTVSQLKSGVWKERLEGFFFKFLHHLAL